jgi:hypothetical protein
MHGDLVYGKPVGLGEKQELGVKEPVVVLDVLEQHLHDLAPACLEPALGV